MPLPSQIIKALNDRGRLYEVGGAVRDRLRYALSRDTGELDPARFWGYAPGESDYLVTGLPLDELTGLLGGFGPVELVGKAFGILKFKLQIANLKHRTVDIALPRKERSTGIGHRDFDIECDPALPVTEDLQRRDFTINAMALRITNSEDRLSKPELVDPCGGVQDIRDNLIRLVSPEAFEQDPLRMLRACQFAARFEYAVERDTFNAISRHSALVTTVPPERVQQELNKLLTKSEQPSIGLWLMQRSGLLAHVLPELEQGVGMAQPGDFHRYTVFEHCIRAADFVPRDKGLELRLAGLLHDVAKPRCRELGEGLVHFYGHDKEGEAIARAVLARLKYSKEIINKVARLVRWHMFAYPETEKGLRRLIAKTGEAGLYDLIELRRADILAQGQAGADATKLLDTFEQLATEQISSSPPFSLRDLAIGGDELQREFGLRSGPLIGELLGHLLEFVLEHPTKNTREDLLDRAARWLAQR